jgi:ribosomal protein L7Ae-like RNA K-turn-binding protein
MQKIESLFKIMGFARKAAVLAVGKTATIGSMQKRQLKLVILATDLSPNAAGKLEDDLAARGVPVFKVASKDDWGRFFGRTEVGIIGVKDANFARSVKKILSDA